MKFGFDLDETITPHPRGWAAICNALLADGHEVHIITYRSPIYHKEQTIKELESYGLKYTELHMTGQKDVVCETWGIDMAFDDSAPYHYPNYQQYWVGVALPKNDGVPSGYGECFYAANDKPEP
ncbi:MAG: hypothetical protein R3213_09325 [Flavobacteriaceae bacterium]|nr:hypothetical protein [Flavobacteriaceae bacterium]